VTRSLLFIALALTLLTRGAELSVLVNTRRIGDAIQDSSADTPSAERSHRVSIRDLAQCSFCDPEELADLAGYLVTRPTRSRFRARATADYCLAGAVLQNGLKFQSKSGVLAVNLARLALDAQELDQKRRCIRALSAERPLSLAQRAMHLEPTNPEVVFTAGMILIADPAYRNGGFALIQTALQNRIPFATEQYRSLLAAISEPAEILQLIPHRLPHVLEALETINDFNPSWISEHYRPIAQLLNTALDFWPHDPALQVPEQREAVARAALSRILTLPIAPKERAYALKTLTRNVLEALPWGEELTELAAIEVVPGLTQRELPRSQSPLLRWGASLEISWESPPAAIGLINVESNPIGRLEVALRSNPYLLAVDARAWNVYRSDDNIEWIPIADLRVSSRNFNGWTFLHVDLPDSSPNNWRFWKVVPPATKGAANEPSTQLIGTAIHAYSKVRS
jgi:hypothetical protein